MSETTNSLSQGDVSRALNVAHTICIEDYLTRIELRRKVKSSCPVESEPSPAPVAAVPQKSEFETLAAKGSWEALSEHCEGVLSTSPANEIEARLWWVRSQLELNSVPSSILAAPLDSVSQIVVEKFRDTNGSSAATKDSSVYGLAAYVLSEMSTRVRAGGDTALALTFLERAYRLDRSHAGTLKSLVEESLSSSEAKGGRTTPHRRQMLENLRAELTPKSNPITSAAIEAKAKPAQITENSLNKSAPKRTRAVPLLFLTLLIAGAGFYLTRSSTQEYSNGESNQLPILGLVRAEPELKMPALKVVEEISNLDGLFYHIERNGGSNGAETVKDSEVVISIKEKEIVNTSTPVEGAEFASIASESSGSRNTISASAPSARPIAPRFAGRDSVDDIDRNDPRLMTVDKFTTPKRYKLISRTDVMARPSYLTFKVGELDEGASVYVLEELGGKWLKIRAGSGKIGYILAQDAVEDNGGRG